MRRIYEFFFVPSPIGPNALAVAVQLAIGIGLTWFFVWIGVYDFFAWLMCRFVIGSC